MLVVSPGWSQDPTTAGYFAKAQKGWETLEKQCAASECSCTATLYDAKGRMVNETEYYCLVNEEKKRIQITKRAGFGTLDGTETVTVRNPSADFQLIRKPDQPDYMLGAVAEKDEHVTAVLNRELCCPYSSCRLRRPMGEWPKDQRVSQFTMRPERHGNEELVRLSFRYDPDQQGEHRNLRGLTALLDPQHDWRITEMELEADWGKSSATYRYGTRTGLSALDLEEITGRYQNKQGVTTATSTSVFKSFVPRAAGDEEFRMAAFGIPDITPPGARRPDRWAGVYVWLALLALSLSCGVGAFVLWRRARRATAGASLN